MFLNEPMLDVILDYAVVFCHHACDNSSSPLKFQKKAEAVAFLTAHNFNLLHFQLSQLIKPVLFIINDCNDIIGQLD